MYLVEESLTCTRRECGGEFVIKTKPAIEKQNMRCTCGSDLKKVYHSPVLTIYGTTPPHDQFPFAPKESATEAQQIRNTTREHQGNAKSRK
jgi:hypothetical protein